MIDNTKSFQNYEPHKLYSLKDMIQFIGDDFLGVMRDIQQEIERFKGRSHESIATTEEYKRLEDLLDGDVAKLCQQLGLKTSEDRCCALANKVLERQLIENLPCHEIKTDLDGLADSISREVAYTHFAYISEDKCRFFEQDALFGEPFHKNASAEINAEIKAAGNCLAADLNTAAVFHLMRIVEFGLRGLARHLNVDISDEDLEYKQWQTIIDQIRSKVKEETKCSGMSDKEKSETREFYNGTIHEFEGFKDVWRNHIMHTRGSYRATEAVGVHDRVRDFMKRLATRVSLM